MGYPFVFVSYSWDSREHQTWVREVFANGLRRRGIDAQIDQHNVTYGDPIDPFMEEVMQRADHLAVICTPNYYQRAALEAGGVGYEKPLIKRFIETHGRTRQVVPVLRAGDKFCVPPWLGSRIFMDLRPGHDDEIDVRLDELAGVYRGEEMYRPPAVTMSHLAKQPTPT
jgi:hypothetical protein